MCDKNNTYYIVTFGCQMNEHDSSLIAGLLKLSGYTASSCLEDADIVVVNTCCIRETAEQKILSFLGSLKVYARNNPSFMVVVYGCMVQAKGNAAKISRIGNYIGVLAGTSVLGKIPFYIEQFKTAGKRIIDISIDNLSSDAAHMTTHPIIKKEPFRATVSIIYGCDNFCSYCIVPYVKGRERSRMPEPILSDIHALAESGCKEVLLLGQNVNSYGKDIISKNTTGAGEYSFARLLRQISRVDGLKRIRYMTSHPRDFNKELLETIASEPKVCKHFHLPVQSGSDKILAAMNRGYNTNYYKQLISDIRTAVPKAVITTDIIVGFPGETESDFNETLRLVSNCLFDAAYTFMYSSRNGTSAAKMPEQVDKQEKKQRLYKLTELQNSISLKKNQDSIGSILEVLVEGKSKNNGEKYSARTEGNKVVIFSPCSENIISPGDLLNIKISAANTWNLFGNIE